MKRFLYRLFFTKSDEVDTSQILLLLYTVFYLVWVVQVSTGHWIASEPMLDAFLIIYASTVILASPSWLVRLWIEHKWFHPSSSPQPTPHEETLE